MILQRGQGEPTSKTMKKLIKSFLHLCVKKKKDREEEEEEEKGSMTELQRRFEHFCCLSLIPNLIALRPGLALPL